LIRVGLRNIETYSERLQVVHGNGIVEEVEQSILKHTSVTVTE
jgi:hypothetical protein